uniref:hypothetical protein n=1 Tax=Halogeometricum limi TaxID=555875 RepID=UPI0026D2FC28
MTEFDLVVLGGGTGNIVASAAADDGMDVALVERDRLGGTCLNRGCNPRRGSSTGRASSRRYGTPSRCGSTR